MIYQVAPFNPLLSGLEEVECPSGKMAHLTRISAQRHMEHLREQLERGVIEDEKVPERLGYYECELGGRLHWHVGHNPRKRIRPAEAQKRRNRRKLERRREVRREMRRLVEALLMA